MNVVRLLLIGVTVLGVAHCAPRSAQGQAATAQAAAASDITPTEEPASGAWGWLKKPSITMPKLSFPKMPADPLSPFKTSAKKVGDGAKKAWEGTKELFTVGGPKNEEPAARVASSGESPSMFQRMFGGGEEPQKEGPATVGEWMSQPRVE